MGALDEIDVWNRAAGGPPDGGGRGDSTLGLALAFHGYAEGDGVIAAMEVTMEEEDGLWDTADAFLYFGLEDVSSFIRTGHGRLVDVWELEDEKKDAELEDAFASEYAGLNVETRLTEALRAKIASHPGDFATT